MFAPIAISRITSVAHPLSSRALRRITAATALVATLGVMSLAGTAAVAEEGDPAPTPVAPVAVADAVTVTKRVDTWITVTGNDSDADSTFYLKDVTQPVNGQVFAIENTRFRYESDYGFSGVDTVTYRLKDTTGLYSEWVTVDITVPNANPVAVDDHKQGAKNVMNSGNVTTNDTDPDDTQFTVTWGNPSQPGFTGNDSGAWQWLLGTWGGVATIPYTLHDPYGGTDEGLLTVVVPEYGDDAPILQPDSYSMVQDTVLTVDAPGVLGNDDDPDGSPFQSMIIPSSADHGVVVGGLDGSFTYTPDAGFVGKETFIYQAIDTDLHKSAAEFITVTVTPATEPQAFWDLYWTAADTALVVSGDGVLSNDVDAASAEKLTDPAHGTVSFNANGKFTYQPDAGFTGSDSFTYRAINNVGPSNPQTVFIEVGGNKPVWFNPPVAVDDNATAKRNQDLWIKVRDNDTVTVPGGSTIVPAAAGADHGTLASINHELGMIRYSPDAGYVGPDEFSYAIYDSHGVFSNWATVSINVTDPNNQAPDVTNLQITRATGDTTPSLGNVLDLVSDDEGDPVTITWDSTPAVGNFVHDIAAAGNWQWMPPAGYVGTQTIAFTATDVLGASAQGTISIAVVEDAQAPIAIDDAYSTMVGTKLVVNAANGLFANDSDADSPWADIQVATNTTGLDGTVTVAADGSFEFTPTPGFNGTTMFTYQLTDADGRSSAYAKVTISVGEAPKANVAPIAVDDSYEIGEDSWMSVADFVGLLANDTDADGDQLKVTGNSTPANGTVTVAADGSFEYTPGAGFSGTDSFEYTVTDGTTTASATVTFMVTPAAVGEPGNPSGEPGNPGGEPAGEENPQPPVVLPEDETASGSDKGGAGAESEDNKSDAPETAAATLAEGAATGSEDTEFDATEAADDEAADAEGADDAAVTDEETDGAVAESNTASDASDTAYASASALLWVALISIGACVAAGIWIARRMRARSNAAA